MGSKIVAYAWFAVAIVALYTGYRFYSRWDDDRKMERQLREKEAAEARKKMDLVGGDTLKILQFYTTTPSLAKGGRGKVCYGVANAKNVNIEPETERVWPALARCIDIAPRRTTEYTLKADDGAGHDVTATALVEVK